MQQDRDIPTSAGAMITTFHKEELRAREPSQLSNKLM
jgi:hypothetical protein